VTPRPLVFISAVSRELKNARRLVANTLTFLGYQPVWQDIFGTESGDLRGVLRQKIDQCKGVVQLVGQCYGAEPPVTDEQFGRMSYTQYEALYARQRGKKVWYLFIDERFPIEPCQSEPEELRDLQAAYRRRLQTDTHLFHALTSSEALEASVLKLRDDLTRLRRGVKQWAIGVTALLAIIAGLVIWQLRSQTLMRTEMRSEMAKLREGIMAYPQVEAQVRGSQPEKDPGALQERVYAELAKQLKVDPKLLREKLPRFAEDLKRASAPTSYERANAAYVANDYSDAERLALQAADEASKSFNREKTVEALELAGWSAEKRIDYTRAIEHFREAEKLTDKQRDPKEWARVQHAISYLLDDEGRYSEAENILRKVIEVRTHVLGAEHPDTLLSRNTLANEFRHEARFAEAEVEHRDVMNLREKILGAQHPDTLASRSSVASDLLGQGKFAEAEVEDREVMNLREKTLGPQHPDTLASRHNLATVLHYEAKNAEAEAQYREVIKSMEKVLGAEHPDTLNTRFNLADTLLDRGKYGDAEEQLREIIKLQSKALGSEHPDTLWTRSNLARALYDEGRCADAEAGIRPVIKLEEKAIGAENSYTVGSRYALANALACQGKYAEAEAEYRIVIKLWGKLLGPENPGTVASRSSLDKTLLAEGKDAEADMREVIKLQEKIIGPEHPDTLESCYNFASGLTHRGKIKEAKEFARRAAEGARKVLGPEHPSARKYEKLLQELE
jgi:tetratricopeptide (TPR) repeat protein